MFQKAVWQQVNLSGLLIRCCFCCCCCCCFFLPLSSSCRSYKESYETRETLAPHRHTIQLIKLIRMRPLISFSFTTTRCVCAFFFLSLLLHDVVEVKGFSVVAVGSTGFGESSRCLKEPSLGVVIKDASLKDEWVVKKRKSQVEKGM